MTQACGLVGISRSLYRYRSRRAGSAELVARLKELAAEKQDYGYRPLHVLLWHEGHDVNHKRMYRLYHDAGMAVKRRIRKRHALSERRPLPKPIAANISWSMDFVSDGLADGRKLRCLNIVARRVIEHWRCEYNERPHSRSGYLTPAGHAAKLNTNTEEDKTGSLTADFSSTRD